MGVLSKRYGEIRFDEGYAEGQVQGKAEADELRLGCCDDVYLKGYDAGARRVESEEREKCDERVNETAEHSRLYGFEEGYDEAKLVFDPEGGYEDVKVQAYDRGWRAGEQAALNGMKTHRSMTTGEWGGCSRSSGEWGC